MCRGLGIDDNLDINSWTAMHTLAPVLFINIARFGLSFTTLGRVAPSTWDLICMHAIFTVLHWTDEWLETHTSYGFEYIGGNLFTSSDKCEAESNWYRDSPGDAISGYFGSLAQVGGCAVAQRVGGILDTVNDPAPMARAVHLAASWLLWATARPLALAFDIHGGGLGAVAMFALVSVPCTQLAAAYAIGCFRSRVARTRGG